MRNQVVLYDDIVLNISGLALWFLKTFEQNIPNGTIRNRFSLEAFIWTSRRPSETEYTGTKIITETCTRRTGEALGTK